MAEKTMIEYTHDLADSPVSAAALLDDPGASIRAAYLYRWPEGPQTPGAPGLSILEDMAVRLNPVLSELRDSAASTRPVTMERDDVMVVDELDDNNRAAREHTTLQVDRDGAEWIAAYLLDDRWDAVREAVAADFGVDLRESLPGAERLLGDLDAEFEDILPERRGRGLCPETGTFEQRGHVRFDREAAAAGTEPLITKVFERGTAGAGPMTPEDPLMPRAQELDRQLAEEYPAAVALRSDDGLSLSLDRREAEQLWAYLNDDRWSELEEIGASPFAESPSQYDGDASQRLVDPRSRLVLLNNLQQAFPARPGKPWEVNEKLYPDGQGVLDRARSNNWHIGPTSRHFVGHDAADANDLLASRAEHLTERDEDYLGQVRKSVKDELRKQTEAATLDVDELHRAGIDEAVNVRAHAAQSLEETVSRPIHGVSDESVSRVEDLAASMHEKAVHTSKEWESACTSAFEQNTTQHERQQPAPQPTWGAPAPTTPQPKLLTAESSVRTKSSKSKGELELSF